jgi:predicted peroxiredoxin
MPEKSSNDGGIIASDDSQWMLSHFLCYWERKMKRLDVTLVVSLLLITLLVASIYLPRSAHSSEDGVRPIFVNLTTGEDDLQKASMGLALVRNSLASGRDVTLFLNVHALALADKSRTDLRVFRTQEDVHDVLHELIADGASVLACPYCMEKNELALDDLLEGIETAAEDNFFAPLDANAAVFSY